MRVERVGVDRVRQKFADLKRKREEEEAKRGEDFESKLVANHDEFERQERERKVCPGQVHVPAGLLYCHLMYIISLSKFVDNMSLQPKEIVSMFAPLAPHEYDTHQHICPHSVNTNTFTVHNTHRKSKSQSCLTLHITVMGDRRCHTRTAPLTPLKTSRTYIPNPHRNMNQQ